MDKFDLSDDENLQYLLCSGIKPCLDPSIIKQGSQLGKTANKSRELDGVQTRLLNDYFGASPKYDERGFERHFRLPRRVFEKVYRSV